MNPIAKSVHEELKKSVDRKYNEVSKNFFKEEIRQYGVRYPVIRKIASTYFAALKGKGKGEVFALCEELMSSGLQEPLVVALDWAQRMRKHYKPEDFETFREWTEKYVTNWAACDGMCIGPLGTLLSLYPELMEKTFHWTNSGNRWLRRAAAVSLILPTRKQNFLQQNFKVADALLLDEDDLVQKGYGWMLKEASNRYPKEVFQYVMRHKGEMPRTALRYAIEKMPIGWKKKALS